MTSPSIKMWAGSSDSHFGCLKLSVLRLTFKKVITVSFFKFDLLTKPFTPLIYEVTALRSPQGAPSPGEVSSFQTSYSPQHFLPQTLWDGGAIDTGPLVHPHWRGEFGNTVLQFKSCISAKRNPLCTDKKESNLNSQSQAHRSPLLPGQLLKQVNSWSRKTKLPEKLQGGGRLSGGTSAWRPSLSPAPGPGCCPISLTYAS